MEAAQNAAEAEEATADGSDWDTSGLSEDWGADAAGMKAYCCVRRVVRSCSAMRRLRPRPARTAEIRRCFRDSSAAF